jgi:hypothetical protein
MAIKNVDYFNQEMNSKQTIYSSFINSISNNTKNQRNSCYFHELHSNLILIQTNQHNPSIIHQSRFNV